MCKGGVGGGGEGRGKGHNIISNSMKCLFHVSEKNLLRAQLSIKKQCRLCKMNIFGPKKN